MNKLGALNSYQLFKYSLALRKGFPNLEELVHLTDPGAQALTSLTAGVPIDLVAPQVSKAQRLARAQKYYQQHGKVTNTKFQPNWSEIAAAFDRNALREHTRETLSKEPPSFFNSLYSNTTFRNPK